MLIDPDRDMTHIDIGISRSKVKVRRATLVKWVPLIILRTVYHTGSYCRSGFIRENVMFTLIRDSVAREFNIYAKNSDFSMSYVYP